jgi:hypothetical protein
LNFFKNVIVWLGIKSSLKSNHFQFSAHDENKRKFRSRLILWRSKSLETHKGNRCDYHVLTYYIHFMSAKYFSWNLALNIYSYKCAKFGWRKKNTFAIISHEEAEVKIIWKLQAKIDFLKWYLSVNSSEIYGKFRVFGPKKIKKIDFSLYSLFCLCLPLW